MPEICLSVHLYNKQIVAFLKRPAHNIHVGQISPLDSNRRQTIIEECSIEFSIPALQKFRRPPMFLRHSKADAPNDRHQSQNRNGDVDAQAHVVIVWPAYLCGNG
jgi:hypothetical protein